MIGCTDFFSKFPQERCKFCKNFVKFVDPLYRFQQEFANLTSFETNDALQKMRIFHLGLRQ